MEEFVHDEYTRKAMDLVRRGHSFFITGKAGTGKTKLLKKIVQECRANGKNIAVAAPTGVAAKNAEGQTLHSMFGLKTSMFIPDKMRLRFRLDESREKVVKNLDILIIDEISMVRCDLMDKVDLTLKHYKNNKKPFGGIQVVLFGDLFQLPPVVTEEDESILYSYYDNQYFFSSDVIKEHPFQVLELRKVHRQEDPIFVNILNNIREGKYLASDRDVLNKRLRRGYEPSEHESAVYLRTLNRKVWGHNMGKLESLPGKEESFKAYIEDYFPKEQYPTDYELKLKVGAKVMLLRNDNDGLKYVNGTQGVISSIYDGTIRVKTDENELITVERSKWDLYNYIYDKEAKSIVPIIVGSFTQFPIKLAWAVTIHKSQGMTFEKAIVDARQSFAPGQVYVALSRCRSLDGLTLTSRISEMDIKVDPIVVDYLKSVERISPDELECKTEKEENKSFFFGDNGKTITGISSEIYGNIVIPDGVEKIAENAFEDNTNITGVICPDSLREIGDRAFIGCRNLYDITLNTGLHSIGMEAFFNTGMGGVELPYTLKEISLTPFECEMHVHVLNPYFADISGVLYDHEEESLILYPRKSIEKHIVIPDTVIRIEAYAFENNKAEEIVIPEEIEELEEHLFNGCQNLKTILIKSTAPEFIDIHEDAFRGFEVEKCVLRVPFDSLSEYKKDERFNDFKYITAIEGSRCLKYDENGTEVIGCDEEDCDSIEIPEGVTSIKDNAFEGNEKIESVILPESLESIGNSAFSGCGSLKGIELKDGLISIGWDAFRRTGLTHVMIPYTVQDIGFSAFGCKMEVDSINTDYCDIDGTLYSFDETELIIYPSNKTEESFEISKSVTAIESYAFEDSCLKSLSIPSTIERIGGYILSGCSDLKEIIFKIEDPRDISRDKNMFDGFNKSACKLIIPKGCRRKYSSIKQFQGFLSIVETDSEEEEIIEEYKKEETKFVTGQFFERLPSYQLKESKVFCYIYSKWRCSIVSTQDGFFLNILHGGYYFLSKHVSQFKLGGIWVQNKRDTLSSYDFSFSPDNKTNIPVGHFSEGRINGTLSYRDLTNGQSFTIHFEKG